MIGILDGIEATASHTCEVFINGMIDIIGVELVDKNFLPVDWVRPRDTVYTLLLVNNPTGYNIKGFTKIDDNRWYRAETLKDGWNTLLTDSFEYYNDYISEKLYFPAISDTVYKVKDNRTQYISTPYQLMNMADGYYYELANDIDLAGTEWVSIDFDGIFDGKGYTIKNLTSNITATNESVYAGLFNNATGIICNLNMSDAVIDVTVYSNDVNRYNVYCGALVAYSNDRLYINNCSVNDSSIKVVSPDCNSYVGGLVGSASKLIIKNCQNSASVNNTYAVGGLVGYAQSSTIKDCTNNGKISGNSDGAYVAGGIVGLATNVSISGCANNEEIRLSIYSGGIIGHATNVTFDNCSNNAAILGMYTAGGIAGYAEASTVRSSKNSGDVKGSYSAGGFVGVYENTTIIDSTNSGSVVGNDTGA